MKGKLMKKICTISLSALMLAAPMLTDTGIIVSASLPVYAATAETPASSFKYSVNKDSTVTITGYTGSETDIIIPGRIEGKKVTSIGNRSFYEKKSLTGVTIPDSVTSIGNFAFTNCTNMTSVTIPNSVISIGEYAFQNSALTSVTIPNSVTSIEKQVFYECRKLSKVMIGDGVKSIGSSAFESCVGLTNLTLGNNIQLIGTDAFYGCEKLKSVTIPASTKEIGYRAFSSCESMTSAYIENGTIGASAFSECSDLASVTMGNGVKTIGNNAFSNCYELKKIRGNKGSFAETYANNNHYKFVAVEFANQSTLSTDFLRFGKQVAINCKATLGTLPYTYAVYYRKVGESAWSILQGYKAVDTVMFKPKEAAPYEIRVNAKDKNDKVIRKDFTLSVMANLSKLGAESINLGDKVKVRCFAKGGAGDYQYAVYYKKSTSSHWSKIRDYGTNNIIMLTPKAAVRYDVRVDIKDKSGNVVSKTLTLTVTK